MPCRSGTIGGGIDQRQAAPDLLDAVDEFHLVTRWDLEANRLALADLVAGCDSLHRCTCGFDSRLEALQVGGVLHLEREPVDPDAGVLADRKAVMITFVPALQEDSVVSAF